MQKINVTILLLGLIIFPNIAAADFGKSEECDPRLDPYVVLYKSIENLNDNALDIDNDTFLSLRTKLKNEINENARLHKISQDERKVLLNELWEDQND